MTGKEALVAETVSPPDKIRKAARAVDMGWGPSYLSPGLASKNALNPQAVTRF
jgi:hypothetical protein